MAIVFVHQAIEQRQWQWQWQLCVCMRLPILRAIAMAMATTMATATMCVHATTKPSSQPSRRAPAAESRKSCGRQFLQICEKFLQCLHFPYLMQMLSYYIYYSFSTISISLYMPKRNKEGAQI